MSQATEDAGPKRLNIFERCLSLWVGACMLVGIILGKLMPESIDTLRRMEFGSGSQINFPIAVLLSESETVPGVRRQR